jgi:ubiquinone/menaquinone biosynthesis C-methylase UbiE
MRWLPFVFLLACGGKAAPAPAPAAPAPHTHGHHHSFTGAEEWSKVFDDPARDAWQKPDDVVALLSLQPGMTVADLGAGTGYFLARLSAAVGPSGHVIGLDVEPDMVRYMTERAAKEGLENVTAQLVTADDPGLPDQKVDRVLVVDTWHHIDDRVAYVKKLREHLAPGGFVLVVDFTKEATHGPPVHARLTPEEVVAELRAGGLEPVVLDEPLPEQFVVMGRK